MGLCKLTQFQERRIVTWHTTKIEKMRDILISKARQCSTFVEALLAPGNAILVEVIINELWGCCELHTGFNVLGKLEMVIQDDIRSGKLDLGNQIRHNPCQMSNQRLLLGQISFMNPAISKAYLPLSAKYVPHAVTTSMGQIHTQIWTQRTQPPQPMQRIKTIKYATTTFTYGIKGTVTLTAYADRLNDE